VRPVSTAPNSSTNQESKELSTDTDTDVTQD